MSDYKNITIGVGNRSPSISLQVKSGSSGNCNLIAKTTAEWEQLPSFIPTDRDIIIYSDARRDREGNPVPMAKAGDGHTPIGNLPFIGAIDAVQIDPDGSARVPGDIYANGERIPRIAFIESATFEYTGTELYTLNRPTKSVYGIVPDIKPDEYSPSDGDILFVRATTDFKTGRVELNQVIMICIWLQGDREPGFYAVGIQPNDRVLDIGNFERDYGEAASDKVIIKKDSVLMLRCRQEKASNGAITTNYVFDIVGGVENGETETGLPSGGSYGDILMKTTDGDFGAAWVAPANSAEQDNTRPITAAAVYTELGNINALLATI